MNSKPPSNRIWLDTAAVRDQLRALGDAWKSVHPNLRRKHMGSALRKVANEKVVPIYRTAAKIFEMSGKSPRHRVQTVSKKTGKVRLKSINRLRTSAGASKLFPGYPSDSAVDMKAGYRRGRYGGGHAMLLADGTRPRWRKGRFTAIQEYDRVWRLKGLMSLKRRVQFISKTGRMTSAARLRAAARLNRTANRGYTGFMKPTMLKTFTDAQAQRTALPDMTRELQEAYEKAMKEQLSKKYQQVMRKYMSKYGNQGLYSPGRGFFQAARNQ